MNDLISLAFADAPVRMIMIDGVPWWVASDVCAVLDLKNPRQALAALEPYQKSVYNMDPLYSANTPRKGGIQTVAIVNESGIYSLIFRSRKPVAKAFNKWLTCDLLPSIRRTGSYISPARLAEVERLIAPAPVPDRQGERFRLEREAFEAREGFTLLAALKGTGMLSPAKLRAIEQHDNRVPEKLYVALDAIGFDMKFIRYGEPRLSNAERALCAAWHVGNLQSRAAMLAVAAVNVPRLG